MNQTSSRTSMSAGIIGLAVLLAIPTANAQTTSTVVNISPVTSDRDNTDPNSASGGRVNQLATHPDSDQIFFAASEWGGLFSTTDAGRNWSYVAGHSAQSTWDVKISPADDDILIATSFFDGRTNSQAGINVSRDGGETWSVPAGARPDIADCWNTARVAEPSAFGIAFDPDDDDAIYVGTNCGLAISPDAGVTWDFADPTPGDAGGLDVWDVLVHDDGTIDLCGDDGHQRSTDGGATFVQGAAEGGGICSLAVSPDEADVIFMSVGTQIFESRDGGANWPTTFVNPVSQGRVPFVKVNDRSGNGFDLWFGDQQLMRATCTTPADTTSNAQRCPASGSWVNAQTGAHWDVGDIVFDTDLTQDACPVLFSNDGGVYFNQLSGTNCHAPSWEQPTTSVTALWLWDMDGGLRTTVNEEGIYVGQQDSGAFGSRDAPLDSPEWNSPGCCDVFDVEAEEDRVVYTLCCARAPARATRMFLDGDDMNGGTQVNTYPPGLLLGFQDYDSLSNYAADSYAVVTNSGVFFTANIGATTVNWQRLGTGAPANACAIYSSVDNNGTAVFTLRAGNCALGNADSLWQHDGATTTGSWTQILRNGQSRFGALAVDPSDSDHIIADDLAGPMPTMVRSTDGGANWETLDTLDDALAGNGEFLLQTQRGPGAFQGFNGYPQASLVAIDPDDSTIVIAGGQDSGVHLSIDSGASWRLLTDPTDTRGTRPHVSRPLYAHFEPLGITKKNVYIGTRGRGAWRIELDIENRWTGAIWRHTGVACEDGSCPGWRKVDNNVRTVDIAAGGLRVFSTRVPWLYQLHFDGAIWRWTRDDCEAERCRGWDKLDQNRRTLQIVAGGDNLYQLHNDGAIWQSTGTACSGDSCPGWTRLDNNPRTIAIEASANRLYQLHRDGRIWQYTNTPCSGSSCPGWRLLDDNARTVDIVATGNNLYQKHFDGRVWRHTGTACSNGRCPGWQLLDNNPRTADLSANENELFQRHRDGEIWRSTGATCSGDSCPGWRRYDDNRATSLIDGSAYQLHDDGRLWESTGTACSGDSCPGWRLLDDNPRSRLPVAADGDNDSLYQLHAPRLYQLHEDGAIWQSDGRRCTNSGSRSERCRGWQRIDDNPKTEAIAASGGRLFQLHDDGEIWRFTGRPCAGERCPGWQRIDQNPRTMAIASGGGQLYQLHQDGRIWRFTGQICTGDRCPGWVMLDNNSATVEIAAGAGQLYQRHRDGRIWRYTGIACSNNRCPGWTLLDNNRRTSKIVAAGGLLHQLHDNGHIWTHTGQRCENNRCPGWRRMDNNTNTVEIAAGGGELYQRHRDGSIWESTGRPCSGRSCPGWRRLDNNSRSSTLTAAGGDLFQLHNNGAIWRSDGRSCSGDRCPGWDKLDNNSRTMAIEAAHN